MTNSYVRTSLAVAVLMLVGCDQSEPVAPGMFSETAAEDALAVSANRARGVVASANGGGHYSILGTSFGDLPTQFSFSAVQKADGTAHGQFHQRLTVEGQQIDVHGTVTCLTVDSDNGRAWVGGVVTRNTSEILFTGEIHQPGRDVWFRVLDDGEGNGAVDRTTFLGFEGGGGIITSAEYCAAQIWPDDNARVHPLTAGQIQVRP